MSKSPSTLPPGVRSTDMLTVTQFATVFPINAINETLEKHGRGTIRVRHLPNEFVVYFVMMLALFRDCSHREVYRCVVDALDRLRGSRTDEPHIPTSAALSLARDRVSDEPLGDLFHRFAVPIATRQTPGAFFGKWRKVAIDGCLIDVEDSEKNREFFGSSTNQSNTRARSPQARFVSLMEIGTHVFFGAAIGSYSDGEIGLAKEVVRSITPDMICLADRNFFSFNLYKQISEKGAALLFRIQRGMAFQPEKQLDDGSYIVQLFASDDRKKEKGMMARLFQYKVTGSANKEIFYMLTNILDPADADAQSLSTLYQERWEFETALDELKTHLNAKFLVLRSKTPSLAKQELW